MVKPLTHKDLARFDELDARPWLTDYERVEHHDLALRIARAIKSSPRLLLDDRWAQYARNSVWGTCVDCPRRAGLTYPEECKHFTRYDHRITLAPRGDS